MATQLHQVLAFTAVAGGGGTATLPHNINWNGRAVIPDLIFPLATNGAFTVISVDETEMTIRNDEDDPGNFSFWLFSLHSIERAFGRQPATDAQLFLAPLPFVTGGGGGGGGGGSGAPMVFRYIVTGAEPDLSDFFVALPVARATDTYRVQATPAGVTVITGIDLPDVLASDRTLTQFRIVTTSPLVAGDQIDFAVSDDILA